MEKNEGRRTLRAVGRTATALLTSAALVLGGLFHGDREALPEDAPAPGILEMISPDTDGGDDGDGAGEENEEKRRVRQRERRLGRLPLGVRLFSGLGVWGAGCAAVSILGALLGGGLSPLLRTLLLWLGMAAVMLAALGVTVKAVFPDMPVKKLLRRRNIRWVLFGAAALGMLEGALLWHFPERAGLGEWLRWLGSMGLLSAVSAAALRRESKRREREKEQKRRESREERDRRKVLALSDSVSRRM